MAIQKAFMLLLMFFGMKNCIATPTIKSKGEWFSIKQGLSQGMVPSIIQDKEGFMWFATKDGLNRYDGYKVKVFRHNTDRFSLPENHITQILEDDYGNFWVGTLSKGVYLFDKHRERFYLYHAGAPRIYRLRFYKNILFIEQTDNLFCYEIKSKILLGSNPTLSHNKLLLDYNKQTSNNVSSTFWAVDYAISILPTSQFIISTRQSVNQWTYSTKFSSWSVNSIPLSELKLSSAAVNTCNFTQFPQHPDSLYILNNQELLLYNRKNRQIEFRLKLPANSLVSARSLSCLSKSELFFMVDQKAYLFNIHTNSLKLLYNNVDSLHYDRLYFNPYIDNNGIIWHGTNGWGVYRTDTRKQQFSTLESKFSLPDMWKECLPDNESLPEILLKKFPFTFKQICKDNLNNYWLAKPEDRDLIRERYNSLHLFKYNLNTKKTITFQPMQFEHGIYAYSLYTDRKNQLWLFASSENNHKMVYQINTENGKQLSSYRIPIKDDYYDDYFVSQAYSDDANRLWLATVRGLICFNTGTKQFQLFGQNQKSVLGYTMFSICADPINPSRYLWLGTDGNGLIKFDLEKNKTEVFNTQQGLPNNVVYIVIPDSKNRLWLSTNKGLCCLNTITNAIRNFTEEDGLANDEFNRYEFLKLKNNQLLFGGMGGYTVFDPDEVMKTQAEVPIGFTGLRISGKEIEWNENSKLIEAPIPYAKRLTLNPNQLNFTISYASLEYRKSLEKFYKYRLIGYQNEWSIPENKNEVSFTNLAPDTYTLQVTGSNSDGIWNKKGASLIIEILPAWYQTWWFKTALMLVLFSSVYGLYRYRLKQQLRVFEVRNRIATDLHDEIGSSLSSIAMYSEAAQKMKPGNENIPSFIDIIHANTKEVLESMSDIVWAVNVQNDSLHPLLNRMRNFAVQLSEVKQFELFFTSNAGMPDVVLEINQRKNIYLIFKEAMNNAAKYSKCNAIQVEINLVQKYFILTVKDNGKGFDPSQFSSINGGNGLFNMRKRAHDIGGDLLIHSSINHGTSISLKLKLI